MLYRFSMFLAFLFPISLAAQHTHIQGVVANSKGEKLEGAFVKVIGTVISDFTNEKGHFKLDVPTGAVRLLVTATGYRPVDTSFSVNLETRELQMDIDLYQSHKLFSRLVIPKQVANNQPSANQIQRSAPTQVAISHASLLNLFSPELTQSMPKVDMLRQNGRAESIRIRSMPERLTYISLDGNRLPSVNQEANYTNALNLIPFNLLEEVHVRHTRRASMDADIMGSSIDFRIRQPQQKVEALLQGSLGTNFQDAPFRDVSRGTQQLSGYLNTELSEEKIFFLVGGNYTKRGRNIDKKRYLYIRPGSSIFSNTIEWYQLNNTDKETESLSALAAFEIRPSAYNRLRISYNFNQEVNDNVSRNLELSPRFNQQWKETANWKEQQNINQLAVSAESHFQRMVLDYQMSITRSESTIDERLLFRGVGIGEVDYFQNDRPSISYNVIDGPMTLRSITAEALALAEKEAAGEANLTYFVNHKQNSFIKAGAKYRGKDRTFGHGRGRGFSLPESFDSNSFPYQGTTADDPAFEALGVNVSNILEQDYLNDDADYTSSENILAGFLEYFQQWSPNFSAALGLRFEKTAQEFVLLNFSSGVKNYSYQNLFPSLHLNYKIDIEQQLRFSYNEAIERPFYGRLGVFNQPLSLNRTILRGNTSLEPTLSRNLDLVYEKYGSKGTSLTLSGYAKLIEHPFVKSSSFRLEFVDQQQILVSNIDNAENASVFGIDASFFQKLDGLGKVFRNIAINASYNYNYSAVKSDLIAQDGLPMIGSPNHTVRAKMSFDHPEKLFSFSLATNFQGKTLTEIVNGIPVYQKELFVMDALIDVSLRKNLTVYGRMNNITNPLIEQYLEVQETEPLFFGSQQYGSWALFGLVWRL